MNSYNRDSDFPLFSIPEYKSNLDEVFPPKQALPLEEPLKEKPVMYTTLRPKPYRILTNICHISCCIHNNAAIDTKGGLWTWGPSSIAEMEVDGQHIISNDLPHQVDYVPRKWMDHAKIVSAGGWHIMCVTNDGTLWAWGQNECGQLGLGDQIYRSKPTPIMDNVVYAYSTEEQTFVVKKDKSLWGWGRNENGLFLDCIDCSMSPVHLLDGVEKVSAGAGSVMIIKEDKTLWGWGYGVDETILTKPTLLMENVRNVSVPAIDDSFSMAVTEDGELYSFGSGTTGSMISYRTRTALPKGPIKVMTGVEDVKTGHSFSLIRMKDGRLFSSGENCVGQCGIGKSTARFYKPALIMDHTSEAAAGYFHGMGLQENGDLWIWGGDYGLPSLKN